MDLNVISDCTVPQREQSAMQMAGNGFTNDAKLKIGQNSVDGKVIIVPTVRAVEMKTVQKLGSLCM
jgi:hypothetical protein